jgi:hypothetical protein
MAFAEWGRINSLAWHPSLARLAVGCEAQGPWIKDVGPGVPVRLSHGKITTTSVLLSPAGDLLIAGNWNSTSLWDYTQRKEVLTSTAGSARQLSRDGTRLAYLDESRGIGVWPVHWPVGWRRLISPRDFGGVSTACSSTPMDAGCSSAVPGGGLAAA